MYLGLFPGPSEILCEMVIPPFSLNVEQLRVI